MDQQSNSSRMAMNCINTASEMLKSASNMEGLTVAMRKSLSEVIQHNLSLAQKEMVNVTDHFMVELLINKMAEMNISLAIFNEPIVKQEKEKSKKVDETETKLSNLSIGASAGHSVIDATKQTSNDLPILEVGDNNATNEQQRRWIPRCYYCGKQGHRMRHCFCFIRKIKEVVLEDQATTSSGPAGLGCDVTNLTNQARSGNGVSNFRHLYQTNKDAWGNHPNLYKAPPVYPKNYYGDFVDLLQMCPNKLNPPQIKTAGGNSGPRLWQPPHQMHPAFSANAMHGASSIRPAVNQMGRGQRYSQQQNFNARNVETFGDDAATLLCKRCKHNGHLTRNCPFVNFTDRGNLANGRFTRIQCHKCHKLGHTAPFCVANKNEAGKTSEKPQPETDQFLTETESSSSIEAIDVEDDLPLDVINYINKAEIDSLLMVPSSSKDKINTKKAN